MKDFITIYKNGINYYVKDNDTIILHFILKYKINNRKIYFTNIKKVLNTLDKYHINYLYDSKKYEYSDNKYLDIFVNAYDKIKLYMIFKNLRKKYNSLSIKDKINILERAGILIDEG